MFRAQADLVGVLREAIDSRSFTSNELRFSFNTLHRLHHHLSNLPRLLTHFGQSHNFLPSSLPSIPPHPRELILHFLVLPNPLPRLPNVLLLSINRLKNGLPSNEDPLCRMRNL
jgi:hypothetical protein